MRRLAVFCSGEGTNLQAILEGCRRHRIPAEAVLVVTDTPKAYALRRARRFGVATVVLVPADYASKAAYEEALLHHLKRHRIDYLLLAGFMRILGRRIVRPYRNRILNIHPALLPCFKGVHAVRDALRYGVQVTGVTVHLVDEGVDTGPIVLQESLRIRPGETEKTLHARIHRVEHRLYPEAIRLLIQKKLRILGRKVQTVGR